MNSDITRRDEQLFADALARPAHERARFLNGARNGHNSWANALSDRYPPIPARTEHLQFTPSLTPPRGRNRWTDGAGELFLTADRNYRRRPRMIQAATAIFAGNDRF
jgi:hypothetical protein